MHRKRIKNANRRGVRLGLTSKQIGETIIENEGNLSATARALGCAIQTIHSWVENHEELADLLTMIEEKNVFDCSNALLRSKDKSWRAAEAFLKLKGRAYGFSQHIVEEHEGLGDLTIRVGVDPNPTGTPEELKAEQIKVLEEPKVPVVRKRQKLDDNGRKPIGNTAATQHGPGKSIEELRQKQRGGYNRSVARF